MYIVMSSLPKELGINALGLEWMAEARERGVDDSSLSIDIVASFHLCTKTLSSGKNNVLTVLTTPMPSNKIRAN